jgi:hypothetical protein
VALPNVSGYRLYRTAAVNGTSTSEVLLTTTSGATLTLTDDGSLTPGAETPLPLGSTGKWASLPDLATARQGAAGAAAVDPADPTKIYFYALLGLGAGNAALSSYEFLPITIAANGHQTAAAGWQTGASASAQARWQAGAYVADAAVSSTITTPTTWIYVGGGITGASVSAPKVEAGKVGAGGDLGAFNDGPSDFNGKTAGYGVCAANGQLFTFGGRQAAPSNGATSASIVSPAPTLAAGAWNNEGLAMAQSRYLMGSSVQSAFIFLLGGDTGGGNASASTELVIW